MSIELDLVSLASLLGATSLVYLASAGLADRSSSLSSRLIAALALVAAWGTLVVGLIPNSLGWDARLCFASRLFSGFLGPLLFLFTLAYLERLERWSAGCVLVLLPGLAATAQFLLIFALVPESVVREYVQRKLAGDPSGALLLAPYPWYGPLLLVHTVEQYGFTLASVLLFLPRVRGAAGDRFRARVLALTYVLFLVGVTVTDLLPLVGLNAVPARLATLLSVPFLFVLHGFLRRRNAEREQMTIEREALLDYLPVRAVDRILQRGANAIEAPADLAIMFTDLRGFSRVSEQLEATEVARWLDGFFTRMSDEVLAEGGFVDKLMGDGVLAVFGISAAAFRAAHRMQRALAEINRSTPIRPGTLLHMGVGIHRGPVVAASLGGRARKTYTVLGDVVNTAQRIESLTKTAGYTILVSRAAYESLEPLDRRDGVSLGAFELTGKDERIELFGYGKRR